MRELLLEPWNSWDRETPVRACIVIANASWDMKLPICEPESSLSF